MSPRVVAIVPSLGAPEGLAGMLAALRRELAEVGAGLIWVHQGAARPPAIDRTGERRIDLAAPVGFARAVHAGLAACGAEAEFVALVNDDLEVEPGWLGALVRALDAESVRASVQGVHLRTDDPARADGCGIGWNRWLQAVQVGEGETAPAPSDPPFSVFGVSATGALYRRAAIEAVALAPGRIFDERLGSWYEDVELAVRLRVSGCEAACVPAARARHAGSATGAKRPFDQARRLAGNRWLVLARLLGRRFPLELPRILARDLVDLARALVDGQLARAAGYPAGWVSAIWRLGAFAHPGPPRVSREALLDERLGSAT